MKYLVMLVTLTLALTGCVGGKDEGELSPSSSPSSKAISEFSSSPADDSNDSDDSDDNFLEKYTEDFPEYSYSGESEVTAGNRHFKLLDTPENIVEELVANSYYYDITGEFDKLKAIFDKGDIFQEYASGIQSRFENKRAYITDCEIKTLSLLKKADIEALSSSHQALKKDTKNFKLTEFCIVKVETTLVKATDDNLVGPGDYIDFFLCGKGEDGAWKLYLSYWFP